MALLTLLTMATGVVLSAVAGMACYMDTANVVDYVGWMPGSELVLAHPAASLSAGGLLMVMVSLWQPSRVD